METPEETEQLLLHCMPAAQILLQTAADHLRAQDGENSAPFHLPRGPPHCTTHGKIAGNAEGDIAKPDLSSFTIWSLQKYMKAVIKCFTRLSLRSWGIWCAGGTPDDIQAAAMSDVESQGEPLLGCPPGRAALACPAAAQRVGELSLQLLQAVADFKEAQHSQHRPLLLAVLGMFALRDAADPQPSPSGEAQVCIPASRQQQRPMLCCIPVG